MRYPEQPNPQPHKNFRWANPNKENWTSLTLNKLSDTQAAWKYYAAMANRVALKDLHKTPWGTPAPTYTVSSSFSSSCNSRFQTYPQTEDPASSSCPFSRRRPLAVSSRSTHSGTDCAWWNSANPSCSSQSRGIWRWCRHRSRIGWPFWGATTGWPWRWAPRTSTVACFGCCCCWRTAAGIGWNWNLLWLLRVARRTLGCRGCRSLMRERSLELKHWVKNLH